MLEGLRNVMRRGIAAALKSEAVDSGWSSADRDTLMGELRLARTQLESDRLIFASVGLPSDCTVSDMKSLVESQSWKAALEYVADMFDAMGGRWSPGGIGRKLRSLAAEGPRAFVLDDRDPRLSAAIDEATRDPELEALKHELKVANDMVTTLKRCVDDLALERDAARAHLGERMVEFEQKLKAQQERVTDVMRRLEAWDESTRQVFAELGAPYGDNGATLAELRTWLAGVERAAERRGHDENQDRWMASIAERWPGLPRRVGILEAIQQRVTQIALVAAKKELFDEDSWPACFHTPPLAEVRSGMQVIGDNILALEEELTR